MYYKSIQVLIVHINVQVVSTHTSTCTTSQYKYYKCTSTHTSTCTTQVHVLQVNTSTDCTYKCTSTHTSTCTTQVQVLIVHINVQVHIQVYVLLKYKSKQVKMLA